MLFLPSPRALLLGALLALSLPSATTLARPADGEPLRPRIGAQFQTATAAPRLARDGFRNCPQFFPRGAVPATSGSRQRPLCYDAFAILHSGETRSPVYVATRLSRASLKEARAIKRRDRFFADARLPRAERAELSDYAGSGYDRGHLAEAAAMPSRRGMAQSFSLANVVPQAPVNNRKPWAKIEADTRRYAERTRDGVYVISGPAYAGPDIETVGANRVWVPTHLFKLVYDPAKNRAWAHWIANRDDARPGRPLRYSEFRRLTGVDWFPGLAVGD